MKKVLISAGGTGGHIIPAVAIAHELMFNNVKVLFAGNGNSLEETVCQKENIDFTTLDVQKLYRKITLAHLRFPGKLCKSIGKSIKIIRDFEPDIFLGTGGFVSGPTGIASVIKKVPIFLQEQNSFPGLTSRFLGHFARKIFLGNAGAKKYFPEKKVIFSGNPLRADILNVKNKVTPEELGLRKDSFKILLIGGSQGSRAINRNFLAIIDTLIEQGMEVIWQVGKLDFPGISETLQDKKGIYAFAFSHDMPGYYEMADIAISRAGALTLAELETKRIPVIVIPLPSAAGNHQYYNALELVNKGTALLLEQKDLSAGHLLKAIMKLKKQYPVFRKNFTNSLHENALQLITRILLRELENRG